jgi:hydroxyethylthiazole kinase-like uncharacterized protein yjeF
MISAYSADDVRAAEAPLLAAEKGFASGLMHRAAVAVAGAVRRELHESGIRVPGSDVLALVGPGNNGGDALHALAILARDGAHTLAVLTGPSVHDDGLLALRAAGGRILTLADDGPGIHVLTGEALAQAFAADVVLDGLLGIGARDGLREPARELVRLLDELLRAERHARSGARPAPPVVVAVDVPSGIGVDDGSAPGPVLTADRTVTMGAWKPGLLLPPAERRAGAVELVDLGLERVLAHQEPVPVVRRLAPSDVGELWPVPDGSSHKYTRGLVGVVAGSAAYPGAAVLTVGGALGAGCPMVRYVGPERVQRAVVAAHPEVVAGRGRVQAWVLGPGVSTDDDDQRAQLHDVLAEAERERIPLVLDAGALSLVTDRLGPLALVTPHAGELATLLSARGVDLDRDAVEAEPLRWAREAHRLTRATVLLKGGTTIVVGRDAVWSQADGPPWLATAGAGDVLAGVLGALLAGRADACRADPALVARLAAAAVLVHGRAAHAANPGGPVTASTVTTALPGVVAALLRPADPAEGSRRQRPGRLPR